MPVPSQWLERPYASGFLSRYRSARDGGSWQRRWVTVCGSPITVRTPFVPCSVTLISLMARECRVGTEVAVANQPKPCRTAAEGVCRLAAELAHYMLVHTCWCLRRESNPESWD